MTRSIAQNPPADLRETLFGDLPLASFAAGKTGEPWSHFTAAAEGLARGNSAAAAAVLQNVLATPQLESRHILQAWHGLREAGVQPEAAEGKRVLGVVIDVPVGDGLDTVAAYADGSARYLNHAGAVILWDAREDRFAACVQAVVAAGQRIAAVIGPWDGQRPALPAGQTRLSMLTPSGLHFGQAPFEALAGEPMAAPLLRAGMQLMQALVEFAEKT